MQCSLAGGWTGLYHRGVVLMSVLDWLLIAAIAAGVFFALRAAHRGYTGSCSGDCTRCHRTGCGKRSKAE